MRWALPIIFCLRSIVHTLNLIFKISQWPQNSNSPHDISLHFKVVLYDFWVMCLFTSDILIFSTFGSWDPKGTLAVKMCFRCGGKGKVRYAWFIPVRPWHHHCPTGISFLFALKWFEDPSCIILFKHISHVDSWYIMYDCVHQLCNAIQAMTIYYLFDSQSCALFNPKLFLPLLHSPNSFLSFVGLPSSLIHACVMFVAGVYSALMLHEDAQRQKASSWKLHAEIMKQPNTNPWFIYISLFRNSKMPMGTMRSPCSVHLTLH